MVLSPFDYSNIFKCISDRTKGSSTHNVFLNLDSTANNSHSSHYTVFLKVFVNMVSNTQSERH